MRTPNRPPKGFKGKSLEAINFNRNDSVGIAIDLINYVKLGLKFNGIPENLEPPNLPTLSEKIKGNIKIGRNNIIKKRN